ncbi:FAD-binding oxidoreductase [Reyranella sp.]|uniref:NAD(P)/FAD-dependent oxidoreductase n=1 Tax=Reyranella sp. TaxID=1929291 RepID=UPI0027301740|nr:FAD-binding oxidoreductase [Reyranella sp.]MDP2374379.1 FAD-binding oxidoreductase [Reyranella sp.]
MHCTADVIVIGAGSTGCSIAFHLARSGVKTVLMDQGAVASGPTGRSVAILRQHYTHPAVSHLAQLSVPFFANWRDEVGGDCGFVRTGFLTAVAVRDFEALKANVHGQRSLGIEVELLSVDQMHKLIPDMVRTGLAGGAYEPAAGYCDPKTVSLALAQGVRRYGGIVLEGHRVHSVRVSGGAICGVDTSKGRFDAPVVVNAAGPWAASIAATGGARLPITTSKHRVALIRETEPTHLAFLPAYTELVNRFYIRPEVGGQYIVGSLDPVDSSTVNPDDCTPDISDDSVLGHATRAGGRFRRLKDARVVGGWASMFDDTPDGNPIIGSDSSIRGSFVAAGLSGHGFKLCPVIGQAVAELITKGKTDVPIQIFSLERFAEGKPLKARHPYIGAPHGTLVS